MSDLWAHVEAADLVDQRGAPMAADSLEAIERDLGVELPEAYRRFMLEGDGVYFVDLVEVSSGVAGAFRELCAAQEDRVTDDHLRSMNEVVRGRIPSSAIGIGDDHGGNVLCLVVDGPERGAVLLWDHERELTVDDPRDACEVLAPSFEAFVLSLRRVP